MTPNEAALVRQIRQEVLEEIRLAAWLERPRSIKAPPPADIDAEVTILATAWESIPVPSWLRPEHFSLRLYEAIYAELLELNASGLHVTVDTLYCRLDALGCRTPGVREELEHIGNHVPAVVPIEPVARRVVGLARRREALYRVERLDALLRLPRTDDFAELGAELVTAADALDGEGM